MIGRLFLISALALVGACYVPAPGRTCARICRAEAPGRPQPPAVLLPAAGSMLVAAPGGAVDMIFTQPGDSGHEIVRRRSTDNGSTWSEPQTVLKSAPEGFGAPMPLLTKDGELQFFWMVARQTGGRPGIDFFIDIWNAYSTAGQAQWSKPERIFEGYVGSINGMTQLTNGRIVLPFAFWVGGRPSGPPTGSNITTTVFSDDGGRTWHQSSAGLTAPCLDGYNGSNYGACEPTVLQRADGRLWMLIRTQTGRLYESLSPDGAEWSPATPSQFCSSDSPGWLVRLPDGRVVLLWNNCENTSRVNGKGVYTNRDALHAAISNDDCQTWHGYREICRDPFRNEPPPKQGDRGTAYPYALATRDGAILCITGQGHGRRNVLRIDPRWLDETEQEEDFSGGLDGWSVFTAFGEPVYWWRNRKEGARLVDHPKEVNAKCLHVRRADENPPDGAVWNFPAGRQGRITLKLLLQEGFAGASIALADRFIQPTDDAGEKKVLFKLPISANGGLPGGTRLETARWYSVALAWDLQASRCRAFVEGQPVAELAQTSDDLAGVSYLCLRSTAATVDPAGFLLAHVHVRVTP